MAKRAIGLDVGTKTIGVAATDALGMMAHPVKTVSRKGVKKDCVELQAIASEREAEVVVVGLPLELDGREERSCRLARQIGARMAEVTSLPVCYVDERFTSVEAERRLLETGMKRKRRKQVIDQVAAVLILQAWLDDGAVLDEEAT
jgi:putative Holliday junction resolvase